MLPVYLPLYFYCPARYRCSELNDAAHKALGMLGPCSSYYTVERDMRLGCSLYSASET